jgi:hypothetical protein
MSFLGAPPRRIGDSVPTDQFKDRSIEPKLPSAARDRPRDDARIQPHPKNRIEQKVAKATQGGRRDSLLCCLRYLLLKMSVSFRFVSAGQRMLESPTWSKTSPGWFRAKFTVRLLTRPVFADIVS